jgi:hypothetical protein
VGSRANYGYLEVFSGSFQLHWDTPAEKSTEGTLERVVGFRSTNAAHKEDVLTIEDITLSRLDPGQIGVLQT